jgi:hypothetical protein
VFKTAGKKYDADRICDIRYRSCEGSDREGTVQKCSGIYSYHRVFSSGTVRRSKKKKKIELKKGKLDKPKNVKDRTFLFFLFQQVAKEFMNNEAFQDKVMSNFRELLDKCDAANKIHLIRFGNSMAAANHYHKHPFFPLIDPDNPISPERYVAIAADICSEPMKNPIWTQNGRSLMCQYFSEKYGACAVADFCANGLAAPNCLFTVTKKDEVTVVDIVQMTTTILRKGCF